MQTTPSPALTFRFQCSRHRPLHWFPDSNADDTVSCIGFQIPMQTTLFPALESKNGEINAGLQRSQGKEGLQQDVPSGFLEVLTQRLPVHAQESAFSQAARGPGSYQ